MNSLLDIESYLEFRKELSRINGSLPVPSEMKNYSKEGKEELKTETHDKLISLFKEYIDWLIEEHEPDIKHQVLYIRKSYELLWTSDERIDRIDRISRIEIILGTILGDPRERGELWKEFKKMYEEKIKK